MTLMMMMTKMVMIKMIMVYHYNVKVVERKNLIMILIKKIHIADDFEEEKHLMMMMMMICKNDHDDLLS